MIFLRVDFSKNQIWINTDTITVVYKVYMGADL